MLAFIKKLFSLPANKDLPATTNQQISFGSDGSLNTSDYLFPDEAKSIVDSKQYKNIIEWCEKAEDKIHRAPQEIVEICYKAMYLRNSMNLIEHIANNKAYILCEGEHHPYTKENLIKLSDKLDLVTQKTLPHLKQKLCFFTKYGDFDKTGKYTFGDYSSVNSIDGISKDKILGTYNELIDSVDQYVKNHSEKDTYVQLLEMKPVLNDRLPGSPRIS